MAAESSISNIQSLPKLRIKSRAPVYTATNMFYYNVPIKNVKHFYNEFSARLLTDGELQGAKDGIYTWVMTDPVRPMNSNHSVDSFVPSHVYAIKTRSSQEIGTLHDNIMSYIRYKRRQESNEKGTMYEEPIFYASGEFEIMPHGNTKKLIFNLKSSLFVQLVLKKRKQNANTFQNMLATKVLHLFKHILSEYEIEYVGYKDLIEDVRILSAPNIIELYNRLLTRKNVTNKQRTRTYSRNYVNRPNEVNSTTSSSVATVPSAIASSASASTANNQNQSNHHRNKNHKLNHAERIAPSIQPTFHPNTPYVFHKGVNSLPNNTLKQKKPYSIKPKKNTTKRKLVITSSQPYTPITPFTGFK